MVEVDETMNCSDIIFFFPPMIKTSNVMRFPFVGKQLGLSVIKVAFLMPGFPIFWEKNRHLL